MTMLSTLYPVEAHFAAYVLSRDGAVLERQPRIAKDALPWLRSEGFELRSQLFVADVDTPEHQPWTTAQLDELERVWNGGASMLDTCGFYLSPRGLRVLQPTAELLDVEEHEARQRAWLRALASVHPLFARAAEVHDWTRLSRVPHYHRDLSLVRSPWIDVTRMVRIDPPEPDRVVRRARASSAPGGSGAPVSFSDSVPRGWEPIADALGAAIRDTVTERWRDCYLALAGALIERSCPPEGVPAVIARAHLVDTQWGQYLADRVTIARTTVQRHAQGLPNAGYNALRASHPAVATVLDECTTEGATRRVLAQLAQNTAPTMTLEEGRAALADVLERPYGVTLVIGPPGLGKSSSTVARVRRLPVIVDRATPGSRWGYSVPTHKLASQLREQAPERAARLFGPLAHTTEGRPTCIHHEAASAWAQGAQSIELDFCAGRRRAPCAEFKTCKAREGWEGPKGANLVIGPAEMLDALDDAAGPLGALVIDEPPAPFTSDPFELEELEGAARHLDVFEAAYADAIGPALRALVAWLENAPSDARLSLSNALRAGGASDAEIDAARDSIPAGARSKAPPVLWRHVSFARSTPSRAAEIGAASRVLDLLRRGLRAPVEPIARAQVEYGRRTIVVAGIHEGLQRALRREGPVVLLDASGDVWLDALTRVLGYEPRVVRLPVVEGAPIHRAILPDARARRTHWLPKNAPAWDAGITSALRTALAWLRERGVRSIGVMSAQQITTAIAHALNPTDATRAAWKNLGLTKKTLEACAPELAELFAGFSVVTAHYGALEGLDAMIGVDATLTLMDPRPNLGAVRDQLELCGSKASDSARLVELAAAELEQAHGRLRTIHRSTEGYQLHIGDVVPRGWHQAAILSRAVGRPATEPAMSAAELRAIRGDLPVREFASALEVSHVTVVRYESTERAIPSDFATRARALRAEWYRNPPSKYRNRRGVSVPASKTPGFDQSGGTDGQA
ncbi:MAG: hypothetical protein JNK05_34850 [Myxococcales bacterium]|nr:hypothetical protein [Myxococcales bacterium]